LSDFINVHFKLQEHLFVAVSKRRSRVTGHMLYTAQGRAMEAVIIDTCLAAN